ncbi:Rieske (2Fe-2S) protein [Nonomuraea sp. NPDC050536]|uniref:Rieske (2Fe-2S) protein n=1 Tax=Nonomuraea sp. NPDC050536 TaxID=3364366 RepID=UPI0037C9D06F
MAGKASGSRVPGIGRREVIGAAGVAVCGLALTACGGGSKPTSAAGIKGKVIAKTADVPVGGGHLVDEWKIMVTQPKQGVYKAFSAVCTHAGCTVGSPEDDVMTCPCHGSEFSCDTGQPVKGPAKAPLTVYKVQVQGDGIVVV